MVYANDNWILFPVKDIFNTAMMQMALNTAKEMYEKGELQIKEFKKDYGTFYSPNTKDMEWFGEQFSPEEVVNELYNNGIDPLRSPEGRAAVRKWIASRPIAELNARKLLAENIRTYLKNYAELERLGKLDKNREAWELQLIPGFDGTSVRDWDFSRNGMFDRLSPSSTNSLFEDTNPWFAKYKPEVIMRANRGPNGEWVQNPNGQYDIVGITDERIAQAMNNNLADYISSGGGAWQYELSKRQLQSAGIENPTHDQIVLRLKDNIISANNSVLYRTPLENAEYVRSQAHQYDLEKQGRELAFRRSEGIANRAQADRHHQDEMRLKYMSLGLDENGNPISDDSTFSLLLAKSKKSNKGILHWTNVVGLGGASTLLLGVPNVAGMSEKQQYNHALLSLTSMLNALCSQHLLIPESLLNNVKSSNLWQMLTSNATKFNAFKDKFINVFGLYSSSPLTIAYYMTPEAKLDSQTSTYKAGPLDAQKDRIFTSEQILGNTKNFFYYGTPKAPTSNNGNAISYSTSTYMPTGRIVTVIDKNNRRCQYFEFYLSGVKDPLYYKAFNTSSPYDITGPGGMIGDSANDLLRSASAERAIGASANVNSGGTYTFSQFYN